MNINNKDKNNSSKSLKIFFIKLISISIAILIIVNLIFNLLFAERLEKIDKLLLLDKNEFRHEIKEKIREELNSSLDKDNLIYEEDKILLYKLYQKLIKEFQDLDKNKL
jgi:hypothetical protein|tara:strand:- start:3812 stop:4138 length:327 start_codon:yes stop_codon:yes gene_type:complete